MLWNGQACCKAVDSQVEEVSAWLPHAATVECLSCRFMVQDMTVLATFGKAPGWEQKGAQKMWSGVFLGTGLFFTAAVCCPCTDVRAAETCGKDEICGLKNPEDMIRV